MVGPHDDESSQALGYQNGATFGGERVVTRSKGNVLDELDNRPILALYQEPLGDRAAARPGNARRSPWPVRGAQDDDRRVARTVIGIDEAAQALTLAAEVPVGSYVRLMHVDPDRLVQGAQAGAAANARFEGAVLGETG